MLRLRRAVLGAARCRAQRNLVFSSPGARRETHSGKKCYYNQKRKYIWKIAEKCFCNLGQPFCSNRGPCPSLEHMSTSERDLFGAGTGQSNNDYRHSIRGICLPRPRPKGVCAGSSTPSHLMCGESPCKNVNFQIRFHYFFYGSPLKFRSTQ